MKRRYGVQGRNGYWAVEEYHPEEPGNATYGDALILPTRKLASAVATQLNRAYGAGRQDLTAEAAGHPLFDAVAEPHAALVAVGARVVLDHPCRICGAETAELHRS